MTKKVDRKWRRDRRKPGLPTRTYPLWHARTCPGCRQVKRPVEFPYGKDKDEHGRCRVCVRNRVKVHEREDDAKESDQGSPQPRRSEC